MLTKEKQRRKPVRERRTQRKKKIKKTRLKNSPCPPVYLLESLAQVAIGDDVGKVPFKKGIHRVSRSFCKLGTLSRISSFFFFFL